VNRVVISPDLYSEGFRFESAVGDRKKHINRGKERKRNVNIAVTYSATHVLLFKSQENMRYFKTNTHSQQYFKNDKNALETSYISVCAMSSQKQ
jgi:hypothetical protein